METKRSGPRGQADPAAVEIDFGQRVGPGCDSSHKLRAELDSISRSWAQAFRPQRRDDVVVVAAGEAMQKQPAPIAVADTEGRVTVAVGVQPARAMTNERLVVDAPAA